MKEYVVGPKACSGFSKRFMRWCVGGGLVEAGAALLVLLFIVFNPYPWALIDTVSPRSASIVYAAAFGGAVYAIYMIVASVTIGVITLVKHRKNKPGWRHYAVVGLTFILYYILWLELYIIAGIPDVRTLCVFVNLPFFIGLLIVLCLSFIWYLAWLIKLYRNETVKYWSWKAFGCRLAGFTLAVLLSFRYY